VKRYFVVLFAIAIAAVAFAAAQDFAGTWTSSSQAYPHTLVLQVNGNTVTGTADGIAISRGYADSSSVQFVVVRNGVSLAYKGVVSGSQLNLQEDQMGVNGSHRNLVFSRGGN
jgi:hypothetical protein